MENETTNETTNGFDFDALRNQATEDETIQAKLLDIVKGTKTGQMYAETIAKNYFSENVSSEHKKIYDFVDKAFIDAGLEKPDGMKTSEFAKMIAEQNKEMQEKLQNLKSNPEISEINKKMDDLRSKYKKEKNELIKNAQSELDKRDSIINELKNYQNNFVRESEINNVLSSLTFNKSYDENVIKDIIQLKKMQLIQNAKSEDGKIVWCKSDGTPYKDGILNASIDVILKQELSHVMQSSTPGGMSEKTPTESMTNASSIVLDQKAFSTQETFLIEFEKEARKRGIPKGEDYNKLYWEAFERYNVKSLREF